MIFLLLRSLWVVLFLICKVNALSIDILDTERNEEVVYQPLLHIAEQLECVPKYWGLYDLLDTDENDFPLEFFKAADQKMLFVMLSSSVCAGIVKGNNPLVNRLIKLIKIFQKHSALVVYGFPPTLSRSAAGKNQVKLMLKTLLPITLAAAERRQEQIAKVVAHFVTNPLMCRPLHCHTSLRLPTKRGVSFSHDSLLEHLGMKCCPQEDPAGLLPALQPLAPFALLWQEGLTQSLQQELDLKAVGVEGVALPGCLYSVADASFFTLLGAHQDFRLLPIDVSIARGWYSLLYDFLATCKACVARGKIESIPESSQHVEAITQTGLTQDRKLLKKRVLRGREAEVVEGVEGGCKVKEAAVKDFFKQGAALPLDKRLGSFAYKKISWMEVLPAIFAGDESKNEQRVRLIDYLFEGGFDALWLGVSPQMYWSPIARKSKESQQMLVALGNFTRLLVERGLHHKKPLPKILIGFEITNNIYQPNLWSRPAHNCFGKSYKDLFCPLDQCFWQQELLDPWITFLEKWRQPEIGNGLLIAGVMIDFEMYCRKTVGMFPDTSGFDRDLGRLFFNERGEPLKGLLPQSLRSPVGHAADDAITFDEEVDENGCVMNPIAKACLEKKWFRDYRRFLLRQSELLGKTMASLFRQTLPGLAIGCYMPASNTDWFYQGMLRGLSERQRVGLLTFDAYLPDWYSRWLIEKKIDVSMSSALLLSKFSTKKPSIEMSSLAQRFESLWFNRISRLVEPYRKPHWTTLENTPLDHAGKRELMKMIAAQPLKQ